MGHLCTRSIRLRVSTESFASSLSSLRQRREGVQEARRSVGKQLGDIPLEQPDPDKAPAKGLVCKLMQDYLAHRDPSTRPNYVPIAGGLRHHVHADHLASRLLRRDRLTSMPSIAVPSSWNRPASRPKRSPWPSGMLTASPRSMGVYGSATLAQRRPKMCSRFIRSELSYRRIGRNVRLAKDTVMDIVKRGGAQNFLRADPARHPRSPK